MKKILLKTLISSTSVVFPSMIVVACNETAKINPEDISRQSEENKGIKDPQTEQKNPNMGMEGDQTKKTNTEKAQGDNIDKIKTGKKDSNNGKNGEQAQNVTPSPDKKQSLKDTPPTKPQPAPQKPAPQSTPKTPTPENKKKQSGTPNPILKPAKPVAPTKQTSPDKKGSPSTTTKPNVNSSGNVQKDKKDFGKSQKVQPQAPKNEKMQADTPTSPKKTEKINENNSKFVLTPAKHDINKVLKNEIEKLDNSLKTQVISLGNELVKPEFYQQAIQLHISVSNIQKIFISNGLDAAKKYLEHFTVKINSEKEKINKLIAGKKGEPGFAQSFGNLVKTFEMYKNFSSYIHKVDKNSKLNMQQHKHISDIFEKYQNNNSIDAEYFEGLYSDSDTLTLKEPSKIANKSQMDSLQNKIAGFLTEIVNEFNKSMLSNPETAKYIYNENKIFELN
ncbi:hypothetical protein [Mycoplasmopsis californica]|nr:hypothetical protein [Mycoplasmopsis californica]